MNSTLKYFLISGLIAAILSILLAIIAPTNEENQDVPSIPNSIASELPYEDVTIEILYYNNKSTGCYYINSTGVKSYLKCVQVESQTVLK